MKRAQKKMLLTGALITIIILILTWRSHYHDGSLANHQPFSKVAFSYNKNGQINTIHGPGTRKISLKHNTNGQIELISMQNEQLSFRYDSLGFLNGFRDNTGHTKLKNDPLGRMKEMIYPGNDTVRYTYNIDGKIATVSWQNNHQMDFERDLFGNIVSINTVAGKFFLDHDYDKQTVQRRYPNGAFSQFTYNDIGQALKILHCAPDGTVLLKFNYTYYPSGMLESAREVNRNDSLSIHYEYDALHQLVRAAYSDGRVYQYEYDRFGNRNIIQSSTAPGLAEYNDTDQLTSYKGQNVRYDAAGNIIQLGNKKFHYNEKDALIQNGSHTYQYNALGWRTAIGDSVHFVHIQDERTHLLGEKGSHPKRYFWADGQQLGQMSADGDVLFFLEDHLGSIRGAINAAGDLVGYASYSPFGQPMEMIPGLRFGFTGEIQDKDGMIYLQDRYYLPALGRFISKDPAMPRLNNDIMINRYAYAANSPLNYLDRNGNWPKFNDVWWQQFAWKFYTGLIEDTRYSFHYWRKALGHSQLYPDEKKHTATAPWQSWHPDEQQNYVLDQLKNHYHNYVDQKGWDLHSLSEKQKLKANRHALTHFSKSHSGVPGYVGPYFQNILNMEVDNINYDWFASIGFMKSNMGLFRFLPAQNLYSTTKAAWIATREADAEFDNLYDMMPRSNWKAVDLVEDIWTGKKDIGSLNSLANHQLPKVGGVYLEPAINAIAQLNEITAITFDSSRNCLVMIGDDASESIFPAIRLADLATAFQTVFGDYEHSPGVTIDPDPENPRADSMIVRFFGGIENTAFANILFEADRIMKGLSLGEDNISRQPLSVPVKGYYNLLQLVFSNLNKKHENALWSRFWLVPDTVTVMVSQDRHSISFPDTRILIKTETMRWQNGELVPAGGIRDEKAEYFARHFTENYDAYASAYPVFKELKNLANMVALAKWLKSSGHGNKMRWLTTYAKQVTTPSRTPSHNVSASQQTSEGIVQEASIFGGADLQVENFYTKDDGATMQLIADAQAALDKEFPATSAIFQDSDQQTQIAVSLPTSETRAAGAKIIKEMDYNLIPRTYCSFHNTAGPFGYSWVLDLPRLKFENNSGNETVYEYGNQKIPHRRYHIATPFGNSDVHFDRHVYDPELQKIAVLPENSNSLIRAIYPDEQKKTYQIIYTDGSSQVFDKDGNLRRKNVTANHYQEFSYDSKGRLTKVSASVQKNDLLSVKLHYDKQARIKTLISSRGETIKYFYDENNDLRKVSAMENDVSYAYDQRHLLTSISNDSSGYALTYDAFGHLTASSNPRDNFTLSPQKTTREYTPAGKLRAFQDNHGRSISMSYDKKNQLKKVRYMNRQGNSASIEYNAAKNYLRHILPDGSAFKYSYDFFGRLSSVSDEKHLLLSKKYLRTNLGWLETSETSEADAHILYNEIRNPVEINISAKTPRGGYLSKQTDYNSIGIITRQKINGLVNLEREYSSGNLIRQTVNGKSTAIAYDAKNRVTQVTSGENNLHIRYDQAERPVKITSARRNWREETHFQKGLMIKRIRSGGFSDSFRYNSQNKMTQLIRSTGESWDILHEERKTSWIRNGQMQMQITYDAHGRILTFQQ